MAYFFIIAAVAAAVIAGLLHRVTLRYSLTFTREHATAELAFALLFGLLRIPPVRGRLLFSPLEAYWGGKRVPLRRQAKPSDAGALLRELILRRGAWLQPGALRVRGVVGSQRDACSAIAMAGALSILIEMALHVFVSAGQVHIQILPMPGARVFCLNMAGMVTIRPWQIIAVALRWYFRLTATALKRRIHSIRGNTQWHTRSKTS
ncbi:MAG: hypothetical protein LBN26_06070 [Christensenellaceae bacterium]|jgi:hypothetical protein|nr:hypothetical protein [Christensenellaceae bacterium]